MENKMTDKPILFQGSMIRAIQAGRKTQTRRIVKLKNGWASNGATIDVLASQPAVAEDACPYGRPGGNLWVRENSLWNGGAWCYQADTSKEMDKGLRLTPSIHMKRAACRINLLLQRVRVEPVSAISDEDAKAEGLLYHNGGGIGHSGWRHDQSFGYVQETPREAFRVLWNLINGQPSPVIKKNSAGKKEISHYVSFPWEDGTATEEFRGKPHYITGNPFVWALDFALKP